MSICAELNSKNKFPKGQIERLKLGGWLAFSVMLIKSSLIEINEFKFVRF